MGHVRLQYQVLGEGWEAPFAASPSSPPSAPSPTPAPSPPPSSPTPPSAAEVLAPGPPAPGGGVGQAVGPGPFVACPPASRRPPGGLLPSRGGRHSGDGPTPSLSSLLLNLHVQVHHTKCPHLLTHYFVSSRKKKKKKKPFTVSKCLDIQHFFSLSLSFSTPLRRVAG